MTDVGTQTSTYNESGSRTVHDGSNYEDGAYNNTESDTFSNSRFESTSLGIGSNGNIVGGTDTYIYSSFGSHSQSETQTGSQVLADPEGGPSYTAAFESLSIVTTSLSSYTNGTLTLGALADVRGGSDTFTFLQANTDSHSLVDTGSNENIIDVGCDSYYLTMTGTEILGTGGSVASGGDWFTWQQGASDSYTLSQSQSASGQNTQYLLSMSDLLTDSFSDVGTDILGASDSILGGSDTYTWDNQRTLESTIIDYGTTAAPYYIGAPSGTRLRRTTPAPAR